MAYIHVINKERRVENLYIVNEDNNQPLTQNQKPRENLSITKETLNELIEFNQWQYDNLTQTIDNKEKKKLMVVYISFALFAILVATIGQLIENSNPDTTKHNLPGLLAFFGLIIFGINSINLIVVKFITALKREIMLGVCQLNLVRRTLAYLHYAKLNGKIPFDIWLDQNKNVDASDNVYWKLYGKFIRYPLDNNSLRNVYFKNSSNKRDLKAIYRSADLFTITLIGLFTLAINLFTLINFSKGFYFYKILKDPSNPMYVFTICIILFTLMFIVLHIRTAITYLAIVSSPLNKMTD